MNNAISYFKAVTTSVIAAISLRLGALNDILVLFAAAAVMDYVTGIISAIYTKSLCSSTGIKGIAKKVGLCALIAVSLLADEAVLITGHRLGMDVALNGALATIVTIWLILNELISILENLGKMDIPLPPFLMRSLKYLKSQSETKGDDLAPIE